MSQQHSHKSSPTGVRAQRNVATRSAILGAAASILASEGLSALSTRRVAALAGATTKVIYSHFGGMAGLTAALYGYGFEELARRLEAASLETSSIAPLRRVAYAYRVFALDQPDLFQIMYGPAIRTALPTVQSRDCAQPSLAVVRMALGGDLTRARQFWAGLHGIVTLEQSGWLDEGEAQDQIDRLVTDALSIRELT